MFVRLTGTKTNRFFSVVIGNTDCGLSWNSLCRLSSICLRFKLTLCGLTGRNSNQRGLGLSGSVHEKPILDTQKLIKDHLFL